MDINTGEPQGSLTSLILFPIYIAGLFKKAEKESLQQQMCKSTVDCVTHSRTYPPLITSFPCTPGLCTASEGLRGILWKSKWLVGSMDTFAAASFQAFNAFFLSSQICFSTVYTFWLFTDKAVAAMAY
jgi:hypothetical protein